MMSKIVCVIAVMAVVASFGQSKPSTENLFYAETFDDVDPFTAGRWIRSSDEKYVEQPLLVKTLSNPVKGANDSSETLQTAHITLRLTFELQAINGISVNLLQLIWQVLRQIRVLCSPRK